MVNYIPKVILVGGPVFSSILTATHLSSFNIQLRFQLGILEQYSYMVIPEYIMQITSFMEWIIYISKFSFTSRHVFFKNIFLLVFSWTGTTLSKSSSIYIQLRFEPSIFEQCSYMVVPEYMIWAIT